MATYENLDVPCVALGKIPPGVGWGNGIAGAAANDDTMHFGDKPLQVWIVGEVVKTWFKGKGGRPNRMPGIVVKPLIDTDDERAGDMTRFLSNPISGEMVFFCDWTAAEPGAGSLCSGRVYGCRRNQYQLLRGT